MQVFMQKKVAFFLIIFSAMFKCLNDKDLIMRCKRCRGSKEVMGMGAVILKCPVCDGVGSVVDSDKVKDAVKDVDIAQKDDSSAIVKSKRKYIKRGDKDAQKNNNVL